MFDKIFKILLLLIIICSKELLVFNEEILILFAFSLFIYLVTTKASSLIAQDLDTNILEIKNKFLAYKNLKEKSIVYGIKYIQRQNLLFSKIQTLIKLKTFYTHKLLVTSTNNFKKYIFTYIEESLSRFALNERTKKIAFHKAYISFIVNFVKIIKKTIFQYKTKKKLINLRKLSK